MAVKKDKEKVLGEVFDDERIKTFFEYAAYGNNNPDHHLLEKAYRGMKADNFSTFLTFFVERSHDINAVDISGQTFLKNIESHTQASAYIIALKQHGAWA
ncbi:MAG: hypothetical protein ACI80S_001706 [Pseudohongiellaceae bacterium]|jgi:hypothetical protein